MDAPPGRWLRGVSITDWMPGPLSPLFATTFVPEADTVMREMCEREVYMRAPRPFLAVIGGRLYLSGDWNLLTLRTFLMPLGYARWLRRLVRSWRGEWLPELRETANAWEVDATTLPDDALLRGIDELSRAGARYWRAAYVPRFAGMVESAFTMFYRRFVRQAADPHESLLLRGTSARVGPVEARTATHLDFVNPTAAELDLPAVSLPSANRDIADAAGRAISVRLGPLRRRAFRALWRSARRWAALREESTLYMGFAWPPLRRLVAEWERRHGLPEGLGYFLTRDELASPPAGAEGVATQRRDTWRRRWHEDAPLMLPRPFRFAGIDMLPYLAGGLSEDGMLRGAGVSPGTATATARVLLSPQGGRMEPGEVLVAPMTTPAWTPLMAIASAIVTDTGGPMSHTSIVAREFGIPAVVGVGDATCRVAEASTITVDGDAGTVRYR